MIRRHIQINNKNEVEDGGGEEREREHKNDEKQNVGTTPALCGVSPTPAYLQSPVENTIDHHKKLELLDLGNDTYVKM